MAAGRGESATRGGAHAPKQVAGWSGHSSTAGLGVTTPARTLRLEPVEGYAGHGRLREELAETRADLGRTSSPPVLPRSAGAGDGGVRLQPVEGYAGYGRLREELTKTRETNANLLRASSSPVLQPPFSQHFSPTSTLSYSSSKEVWNDGRVKYKGCDYSTPSPGSTSTSWCSSDKEHWNDGRGKFKGRGFRHPTGNKGSASGLPGIDGDYCHPLATATQLPGPQALKARSRLVSPLIEQELRKPRGLGAQGRGFEGTVNAKLLWSLANSEPEVPEWTQVDFRTSGSAMPGFLGRRPAARHTSNPNTAGAGFSGWPK